MKLEQAGIPSTHCSVWFYVQVLRIELGSLCLQGKHITNGAILPAPLDKVQGLWRPCSTLPASLCVFWS